MTPPILRDQGCVASVAFDERDGIFRGKVLDVTDRISPAKATPSRR